MDFKFPRNQVHRPNTIQVRLFFLNCILRFDSTVFTTNLKFQLNETVSEIDKLSPTLFIPWFFLFHQQVIMATPLISSTSFRFHDFLFLFLFRLFSAPVSRLTYKL
jgi:hypothetical protein